MKPIGDGYIGAYFNTLSGGKYFIRINDKKLFLERFNREHKLRKDTEKVEIRWIEQFQIGRDSIFCLELLGQGNEAFRFTSEVLYIIYFEGEQSFKAFKLAMIAHEGQTDLAGVDYLEHIKAVGRNSHSSVNFNLKKHEPYSDYLQKVKLNKWARIVKLADLKHNIDISRLENLTKNDLSRLEKYQRAQKFLMEEC